MANQRFCFLLTAALTLGGLCTLKVLYENGSPFTMTRSSACFGHFYLCTYRRLIADNKVYGNISLSSKNIYNFSALERFRSDYFKKYPKKRKIFYQNVKLIRYYMKREFTDKWVKLNLQNKDLSKMQAARLCSFTPHKYFTYSFRFFGVVAKRPIKVSFVVEERNIGNFTHSRLPANIHAVVTTERTKAVCETTDYSNGKYHIECPILEARFVVSFWGSYMPPTVYKYICRRKDNWLLKRCNNTYFERQGLNISILNNQHLNLSTCLSNKNLFDIGFWIKVKDVWHYATLECYYPLTFTNLTRECLKSKRIIMVGDSHMRNRHAALTKKGILNSTLMWSTISSQMLAVLKDDILTIDASERFILVFNTGHWSLCYLDVSTYISDMAEVFDVISQLKKRRNPPQLIWVEITAMPYDRYHSRVRTTATIAALNDWTNYHMRKLGVDIVPAFNISLPMNDQTRDGIHYRELLEIDAYLDKSTVSVGGAVDSVLIRTICPQPLI